ncbi:hypothetical protein RJT34_31718 [Clitoria ternatea]|uniref:Uncharacterized protein n=1 Tax=Clitoria ternatea TaxID=43366 RepID=A0AAN9I3U2_CLITE
MARLIALRSVRRRGRRRTAAVIATVTAEVGVGTLGLIIDGSVVSVVGLGVNLDLQFKALSDVVHSPTYKVVGFRRNHDISVVVYCPSMGDQVEVGTLGLIIDGSVVGVVGLGVNLDLKFKALSIVAHSPTYKVVGSRGNHGISAIVYCPSVGDHTCGVT